MDDPDPVVMDRVPTEDELRALDGNDSYAVIRYDADFGVTAWNRGATLLFGWSATEALGRPAGALVNLPATEAGQATVDDLRRRLRETGDLRHTDIWYAKHGRAARVDAHIFATDAGFVGVMKGERVQWMLE